MTAENNQNNNEFSDRYISRYSSPVINRGLELARKLSITTTNTQDRLSSSIQHERDAKYFLNLAIEQIISSNYQDALINIQKSLDIDPDHYDAYITRYYSIYIPLGYFQEAIDDCTQALQLNPKNVELLTNRGWAYAQLGYHLQALQDYDLALMIRPDCQLVYMNRGLLHMGYSNYQKAIDDFEDIIKINPHNADVYNYKGLALLSLEKYGQALINFKKAIHLDSEHINAYLNKGLCCIYLNNEFQAADSFLYAIDLNSEHAKNYLKEFGKGNQLSSTIILLLINRGNIQHHQSRPHAALKYYESALQIDSNHEFALLKRGVTLSILGRKEEAIADYSKVIKFGMDNLWSYILRSKIYYDLGYDVRAKEDTIKAHILLGSKFLKSGNYTDAIQSYTTALKIDPNNTEAYNRRSTARSAIGDYQGAMEDLQQVRMI
jgi:tetratricopeptide (TPR) repeat protein